MGVAAGVGDILFGCFEHLRESVNFPTENYWRSMGGSFQQYFNWQGGQPNDNEGAGVDTDDQDCMIVNSGSLTWADRSCFPVKWNFGCEFAMSDILNDQPSNPFLNLVFENGETDYGNQQGNEPLHIYCDFTVNDCPEIPGIYFPNCDGIFYTNETVCSGHGDCQYDSDLDLGICVCDGGWDITSICSITSCEGILSNLTTQTCNNHGDCVDFDVCNCDIGFSGKFCDSLDTDDTDDSGNSDDTGDNDDTGDSQVGGDVLPIYVIPVVAGVGGLIILIIVVCCLVFCVFITICVLRKKRKNNGIVKLVDDGEIEEDNQFDDVEMVQEKPREEKRNHFKKRKRENKKESSSEGSGEEEDSEHSEEGESESEKSDDSLSGITGFEKALENVSDSD